MDLVDDLSRTIAQAMVANKAATEAMAEFDAKVAVYDFSGAEAARLKAIANLESYFDQIAAVYNKLQQP